MSGYKNCLLVVLLLAGHALPAVQSGNILTRSKSGGLLARPHESLTSLVLTSVRQKSQKRISTTRLSSPLNRCGRWLAARQSS